MSSILELARPEILALKAYASARSLVSSEGEGAGRITYLDANESPYGELNRYPEPQPRELVSRFGSLYGVSPRNLVVGRGSDEAIDLLVRAFCRAGRDSILICPPTYGVYEIAAQIQGARVLRIPLVMEQGKAPRLNEAAIAATVASPDASVKIVFLCSPNNPTGTAFDPEALTRICTLAASRALVVVDEAYAEFSSAASMIGRLAGRPNLVVLRTLSKAWALAAARCGVSVASEELTALLHKVRAPYPLPRPAVEAVLEATGEESRAALDERVERIVKDRKELAQALKRLPGVSEVFESDANFLLARFTNPAAVMLRARAAGMILRDRGKETGLEGCIRITVGTPGENEALLKILSEVAS